MSALWRCRVCEGVNQGGRVCATCGTEVPAGESLRAAVRHRLPGPNDPAPPPVPPTVRRRELRALPSPEELRHTEPDDLFTIPEGMDIRPMPGGCLLTFNPRRDRRG
jgi:hypothetical protein